MARPPEKCPTQTKERLEWATLPNPIFPNVAESCPASKENYLSSDALTTDYFRRQVDNPGDPIARAPSDVECRASGMGLVREAPGAKSSLVGSSATSFF